MLNTKIIIPIAAIALTACQSPSNPSPMDQAFAKADSIVASIVVPTFCTDTFNIINYGATTNADATTNKNAINTAIDSCSASGGGVVLIPNGNWTTGPITLKSNVNLHLADSATLLFSKNYNDYLPAVITRWEGMDCYNLQPLVYAYNQTNIAITGKGILDGQGSNDNWWYMKGRERYGWKEGLITQETEGRPRLLEQDRTEVPVQDRQFTIEDGLRPQLCNIYKCNNVLLEGVTFRNSPFWTIHPLFVNNLVVRNVTAEGLGPNNDGCDPESCTNVLIEGCTFNTGDDCIAIKSGRNHDGRRANAPTKNVIVRNCTMNDGHGGVVIGSEISGGYQNLWVENCKMSSPNLDRVIRIKTSDCRGGIIENVYVRNVEVGECAECVLKINLKYEPKEKCDRGFYPIVRNVNLENVTSQKSKYGVYILGLDTLPQNVDNITLTNCHFNGVEKGNKMANATNVAFQNLIINGEIAQPEVK